MPNHHSAAVRASLPRPADVTRALEKIYKYYDQSEQPFRLIEYVAHTHWEAFDRVQAAGLGRKQFLAAAKDQPASVSAARALLDVAQAELEKNRSPLELRAWVELVAVLEALADVVATIFQGQLQALDGIAESLKLRISKEKSAGLSALRERGAKAGWNDREVARRRAVFERGLNQRATRIVGAVRGHREAVSRTGASAKTFQEFFRSFADIASEGLAPLVSREVRAPLEREAGLLRRAKVEDVDVSARLEDSVIRRYCGLSAVEPPAPASLDASDKFEAKVFKEIAELVRKRKGAGALSRLTLDLALESRACQERLRLLRSWGKATTMVKKAEQRLQQVEEQCKGSTLKAMCTLGLGAGREGRAQRAEARDALLVARRRKERLRLAIESSGDSLRAFIRSVGDVSARIIPEVAKAARNSFTNGDKEAGEAVSAALSLELRNSRTSPSRSGFWVVVLRSLAAQAMRIRVREIVSAFNERSADQWAGFFPEVEAAFFDEEDARRVHLASTCVGESIFHRGLETFAEEFENVRMGAYHSLEERSQAEKHLQWLRQAEAQLEGTADRAGALVDVKLQAARRGKTLERLHRQELGRIQVSDIDAIQDEFIVALEEKTDKDDEQYVKRTREVIMFTKPVANALLYADSDSGLVQASGKEILLAMERVMLERAGHVKDVLAELTKLYETSRQELLSLPPDQLKQLLKDVPNLSRAMNFLSKAQKIKKDTEGFGMSRVQDWTLNKPQKTIRQKKN